MRRGDIYLADLEPTVGREAGKTRPVVIVSNERMNSRARTLGSGMVTVVPLTSNVRVVFDFQVLIESEESGLKVVSKAQVEQVRSIDIERLGPALGRLAPARLWELDAAIKLHLAL